MASSNHSEIIKQLEKISKNPPEDPQTRRVLHDALRSTTYAMETPMDTTHRISFISLQSTVVRIALDLKLFNILSGSPRPMPVGQIAVLTGANELLLLRLLRYLAANGLVEEPSPSHYAACPATKTLSHPGFQAALRHNVDVLRPCWEALPSFLASNGYDKIVDVANTPFQKAHNTNELPFTWALRNLDRFQDLNLWMAVQREDSPSWLDIFPHDRLTANPDDSSPLFVDVGGGLGHKCEELKQKVSPINRKIILQDLGPPIEHALNTPGVDKMVADFFAGQPVKGAAFYYLKHVLHDYPDEKCIEILKNQVQAMSQGSVLLIDEMALLDHTTHWRSAEMDLALMSTVAAIERNESQWKALFAKVGLAIEEKMIYDDAMQQGVMVVKPSVAKNKWQYPMTGISTDLREL